MLERDPLLSQLLEALQSAQWLGLVSYARATSGAVSVIERAFYA